MGPKVKNQKLWPLSLWEGLRTNKEAEPFGSSWWLRSPVYSGDKGTPGFFSEYKGYFTDYPDSDYGYPDLNEIEASVRPALYLKLSSSSEVAQKVSEAIRNGTYSIEVNPTSITIEEPQTNVIVLKNTLELITNVLPENATNQNATFSSSDKKIATVDQTGKVKAIKQGKVTITAKTVNGKSAKVTLYVIKSKAPTKLANVTVKVGKKLITVNFKKPSSKFTKLTVQYRLKGEVKWISKNLTAQRH